VPTERAATALKRGAGAAGRGLRHSSRLAIGKAGIRSRVTLPGTAGAAAKERAGATCAAAAEGRVAPVAGNSLRQEAAPSPRAAPPFHPTKPGRQVPTLHPFWCDYIESVGEPAKFEWRFSGPLCALCGGADCPRRRSLIGPATPDQPMRWQVGISWRQDRSRRGAEQRWSGNWTRSWDSPTIGGRWTRVRHNYGRRAVDLQFFRPYTNSPANRGPHLTHRCAGFAWKTWTLRFFWPPTRGLNSAIFAAGKLL